MPGVVRLGSMRFSVYGVCGAVGGVGALCLSLKTARLAGLAADALWDAGLFAVLAGFVMSRVMLVAGNVRAFVHTPLALLEFPSFSYAAMVLTGLAVAVYLVGKGLPVLRTLDAWAPCASVVAAFLCLGRFFAGTALGMPTTLPWGAVVPGSAGLMRLQPVAVYGVVGSVGLLVGLMVLLRRGVPAGRVAAVALVAGGALSFGLEMVTQPVAGGDWLEPVQWVAVGAVLVGMLMVTFSKEIA